MISRNINGSRKRPENLPEVIRYDVSSTIGNRSLYERRKTHGTEKY